MFSSANLVGSFGAQIIPSGPCWLARAIGGQSNEDEADYSDCENLEDAPQARRFGVLRKWWDLLGIIRNSE
jgi:hypothetical protein